MVTYSSGPVLIDRGLNLNKIRKILLSSFQRKSGGDSKVVTPVPISNTEVKHFNADGSKLNLARVGSCQASFDFWPLGETV